ncbi:uncharacterized protein LOC124633046 [Helicoverpa zea]|uniref:uncharacterized protein LOC124633046 n=1 Tax=Helicoverpa zea TaxID=7113 RepID=UPI001F56CBB0|nr:uncharacterized protein LOC124633046 [Helicoverpa zea]
MDSSVGQTIERIKMQEQDNEVKLREKRELNNTMLAINRGIRDALTNISKLTKEYEQLTVTTAKLAHQLIVEQTRHSALIEQVDSCCKELEELRDKSTNGISSVWNKRSTLLETIHGVADKCDIWALLIKPSGSEIVPCKKEVQNTEPVIYDDSKLKHALERRNKAIAERNYLLSEPEVGEEFLR